MCIAELVDLTSLSRINPSEISMLVKDYPLGVQINFRYNVEAWQKSHITEKKPDKNITSSHIIPSLSCSSLLEIITLDQNRNIQCLIGTYK